jgi:uncharacterized protein YgbK (DUF1537 family)
MSATTPLDVLVVADDLTGAADTAAAFTRVGLATQVTFAGTGPPVIADGVLALDTDSRRHAPPAAARAVAEAVAAAPAARLRLKKIDSTLRGNVGSETAAMMDAVGATVAVCAPAFPATGRRTVEGIQWAASTRVGEVASCFDGMAVAHVPLEAVRGGAFGEHLARHAAAGARVVVVDAETDDDLLAVVSGTGRVPAEELLWVGSGGLGAALAAALPTRRSRPVAVVEGPALVVVGSATPQAAEQVERIAAHAVRVRVPVSLLRGAGEGPRPGLATPAAAVADALAAAEDAVVTLDEDEPVPPEQARALVEALGALLAPVVVHARPGAILATGGETALGVARALGAEGLELEQEIEPGVVRGRLVGGPPLPMVTKAGGFGDPETLVRALAILRGRTVGTDGRGDPPHGSRRMERT